MALSLVGEVMHYVTGTDITPTERYILAVIAEQANAKTRQAYQVTAPGKNRWVLHERVGLSETGLRTALQRLAGRNLEVRVPLGVDGRGRPFYAVHGRQTTYQLPVFPGAKGDAQPSPNGDAQARKADGQPSANGDVSPSTGDVSPSIADAQPSPFPSTPPMSPNSNAREPRHIVIENTDAKPSEAEAVVARIAREINPRSLGGFLVHLSRQGELQRWVDETRAAAVEADQRAAEDADRKVRQRLSRCEHGTAGGDQPHTVTGEIRCGACRTRHRASQLNSTARVIPMRSKEVS